MKILQSRVRLGDIKGMPVLNNNLKKMNFTKLNVQKPISVSPLPPPDMSRHVKKPVMPVFPAARPFKDDISSLKQAALAVQQIRLGAQQELETIRKMRTDAQKYQQDTATKARSEAHQLVLHARLSTQREIEELIRQASEEIQKVLADIRVIRITAQEELAAQRKFTDAAKLSSMSLSIKEALGKTERKKKKQLVSSKY